jgi:membrane protein YqaA with SNARE-associated domain
MPEHDRQPEPLPSADAPTPQEVAAAEAPVGPVARWAIHRHLYDWVLSFAHHRHATGALFLLSFIESSFFPIPPDVLLGPLCMSNRRKALWFATVTTVASVLGALLGYAIGWGAWHLMKDFMFSYVPGFSQQKFDVVEKWYAAYGAWVLFAAAFTPIPYKVFTVAGGVFHQALVPFILISIVGRGLRFYMVAGLFYWIGPKAVPFIDKYFNWLCVLFMVLLIAGFMVIKVLH